MNSLPFIMLDDKNSALPLYRQIYEAIRNAILSGKFAARMRLPATRVMAAQLGVSRMTVINAYEQLFAEGYLESKAGAGTFVAAQLPEEMLQTPVPDEKAQTSDFQPLNFKLSSYGERINKFNRRAAAFPEPSARPFPFQNGLTAVDKFPIEIWSKIAQKYYRQLPNKFWGYGKPAGYEPLREAIAEHLASARGVVCEAAQVIITNGAQQALDLISRVLLDSEDKVLIEDPCYREARNAFGSVGAQVIPVPVDQEGFDLTAVERQNQTARLVYVTPSHQYPLGVTMSLSRRLKLLEWANLSNAVIVEDDYNSEFRYSGRPLASLQGLDAHGRVIYIGTFSKTIFPALRLGCMVVPKNLVEIFSAARVLSDSHSPLCEQAILAEFIAEGHFARHVRRMRELYEYRQQILVEEAQQKLAGALTIQKADAGMHLIGWLPEGINDQIIAEKGRSHRLTLAALSSYSITKPTRGGLLLGYTAFNKEQITEGIERLAAILQ